MRAKRIAQSLFPGVEVLMNPAPPRRGAFEVSDPEGHVFWSKLKSSRFPDDKELTEALSRK